ncbi:MAG TPA: DinB family protein [Bacteroidia bacterium]|nr:DinB family protein [Bacteroidia bacterium]
MMYDTAKAIEVLERTPAVIAGMLDGISGEWISSGEGPGTWSPYDVVGHLIHGETTDWVTRMEIILSDKEDKTFPRFDRFAQFEESKGKTMHMLLEEFKAVRAKNISILRSKNLTEKDLAKTGTHPSFGTVTLRQLLATWVAHDLNHIAQIARVMAKQYREETGPWVEYLRILK